VGLVLDGARLTAGRSARMATAGALSAAHDSPECDFHVNVCGLVANTDELCPPHRTNAISAITVAAYSVLVRNVANSYCTCLRQSRFIQQRLAFHPRLQRGRHCKRDRVASRPSTRHSTAHRFRERPAAVRARTTKRRQRAERYADQRSVPATDVRTPGSQSSLLVQR
jgi:hypothetical protein